jgi:hypothetical protein
MANGDKRSVSTDALETLGTIIGEGQGRDAIHLAVEPVIAAESLPPGTNVGFVKGGVGITGCDKFLGIVDPFLKQSVQKGERFWLVVYPRQITSLRHVWSHPAFPESDMKATTSTVGSDEQWIRDFAANVGLKYSVLMEGAAEWVESKKRGGWGEYLCFGGLLEGEYVPEEFWPHYEAVTGRAVEEEHRGSFFSCSC